MYFCIYGHFSYPQLPVNVVWTPSVVPDQILTPDFLSPGSSLAVVAVAGKILAHYIVLEMITEIGAKHLQYKMVQACCFSIDLKFLGDRLASRYIKLPVNQILSPLVA